MRLTSFLGRVNRVGAGTAVQDQPSLSFIDHLEARLESDPPKQKGERTRERLKIATAKMLEKKGYHAMRVSDVSDCAKVAEGSFYIYFRDKTDATVLVLTELLENFSNIDVKPETRKTVFDSIRSTNLRWISMCRANAGLMRCILQLGDEEPEFARLSQRSNRIWAERVALSATKRRTGLKAEPPPLAPYMLGAMMDETTQKICVY